MKTDELINAFSAMTLAELHDFVKNFEETFGVTAALPQAVQVQPVVLAEEPEEQEEFSLTLESVGTAKIQVIKEVRALLSLGLAEAKKTVDSAPVELYEQADKDTIAKAKAALEAAGATVSVK